MNDQFTKENIPVICVPITGTTKEEIKQQLQMIVKQKPDMIEWRVDFFKEIANTVSVLEMIYHIKETSQCPLLFTIRSEREGGEKITLTENEKLELLRHVCERSAVDIIDFEVSSERAHIERVRALTKANQKQLILSYHHFEKTLNNEDMKKIAILMEYFEADIAKLAFMPQSEEDVYRLLKVTADLKRVLNIPVITMAMGELGAISRIIGWAFGSVLTFAVGVASSAPGQIPIQTLRQAISAMKAALQQ